MAQLDARPIDNQEVTGFDPRRRASVAQLDARPIDDQEVTGFDPRQPTSVAQLNAWPTSDQEVAGSTPPGRQHSFVEIDHEIFSMVVLSFPLIQGQLSVSGGKMGTILVNRLEDKPAQ